MANEIDIERLREKVNLVLDHISKDLGLSKLAINDDTDFYWEVPDGELYKVGTKPETLDVGRLNDDLEFVELIPHERSQAAALMLIHVAPLFRYLAHAVQSNKGVSS